MFTRRVVAVLLAVFFFVPELPAKDRSDWSKVQKLKLNTEVRLVLWDRKQFVGQFDSADEQSLTVVVFPNRYERSGSLREFKRETVRAIYKAHLGSSSDYDPQVYGGTGALAGGAIGLGVGAIVDANHRGPSADDAKKTGVVGGAILGLLVGGIVYAVASSPRHDKPIYESTHRPARAEQTHASAQE